MLILHSLLQLLVCLEPQQRCGDLWWRGQFFVQTMCVGGYVCMCIYKKEATCCAYRLDTKLPPPPGLHFRTEKSLPHCLIHSLTHTLTN